MTIQLGRGKQTAARAGGPGGRRGPESRPRSPAHGAGPDGPAAGIQGGTREQPGAMA